MIYKILIINKVFDLKGSQRNRFEEDDGSSVLLDENLLKGKQNFLFFIKYFR